MFFDNLFDDFEPFDAYTHRQLRPQTSSLFRKDNRTIILEKLLNDEYNYICFDCHKEINTLNYFDLKNGVFLCYNCALNHTKLPKEISQPISGDIKSLEENDLLIFYYGGNKNLFDFIRRNYPLLENMNKKNMYNTKAMDYYRKFLRSKLYDEPEPDMPSKKKAYNSIYPKKVNTTKNIQNHKNHRQNKSRKIFDRKEEPEQDNIFNSTYFGNDLFNRNKRNHREKERKKEENDEEFFENEPADIKNEENEKDEAGMKIEKLNDIHRNENEDFREEKTERIINHEHKYKKSGKKQKIVEENNYGKSPNDLSINQIGEISMYPEAIEIDKMDCE